MKKDLIQKVFQWGLDRDIYKYSSVPVQLCKFTEELLEYGEAGSSEAVKKDAVGDMIIVALNMYGVENYENESSAENLTWHFYKDVGFIQPSLIPETTDFLSFLFDFAEVHKKIIRNKANSTALLRLLFDNFTLDFMQESLSLSYEEIKDRKGRLTPDGNFVKEGDL